MGSELDGAFLFDVGSQLSASHPIRGGRELVATAAWYAKAYANHLEENH